MNRSAIKVIGTRLYLLPVRTRIPLKFGSETLTEVTCARVRVEVEGTDGRRAAGWGETPLSVQWVWPAELPYQQRLQRLIGFCLQLLASLPRSGLRGHPLEIGRDFQELILPGLLSEANGKQAGCPMPWLAALLCFSPLDLAIHDAYGQLLGRPVFQLYGSAHVGRDLAELIAPEPAFAGKSVADFLVPPQRHLVAWHLVGGLDPLEPSELSGPQIADGHPVLLNDWIAADGLHCLKVKLRGTDADWDYDRLVRVGTIGRAGGVQWLSADFNCTVREPAYVNETLDRLRAHEPEIDRMILYVEQPFDYDLEAHAIDVRSVAARKPLFLDESAHDWQHVRRGRELGWTGAALKTCKTLTGALLAACWARAHKMELMVQDLTNPMLAQIAHVNLASHLPTIMGVETNSMQFYPDASIPEAAVHPGIFRRRNGGIDLSTIAGPGIGYRLAEIKRELTEPVGGFDG